MRSCRSGKRTSPNRDPETRRMPGRRTRVPGKFARCARRTPPVPTRPRCRSACRVRAGADVEGQRLAWRCAAWRCCSVIATRNGARRIRRQGRGPGVAIADHSVCVRRAGSGPNAMQLAGDGPSPETPAGLRVPRSGTRGHRPGVLHRARACRKRSSPPSSGMPVAILSNEASIRRRSGIDDPNRPAGSMDRGSTAVLRARDRPRLRSADSLRGPIELSDPGDRSRDRSAFHHQRLRRGRRAWILQPDRGGLRPVRAGDLRNRPRSGRRGRGGSRQRRSQHRFEQRRRVRRRPGEPGRHPLRCRGRNPARDGQRPV